MEKPTLHIVYIHAELSFYGDIVIQDGQCTPGELAQFVRQNSSYEGFAVSNETPYVLLRAKGSQNKEHIAMRMVYEEHATFKSGWLNLEEEFISDHDGQDSLVDIIKIIAQGGHLSPNDGGSPIRYGPLDTIVNSGKRIISEAEENDLKRSFNVVIHSLNYSPKRIPMEAESNGGGVNWVPYNS